MIAANVLRGDMPVCHWDSVDKGFLLDVRNPPELAVESVPGALDIPLPQLRARLGELPRTRDPRLLPLRTALLLRDAHPAADGFKARNISGAMLSRSMLGRSEMEEGHRT